MDTTNLVLIPKVPSDPLWVETLKRLDELHDRRKRMRKALEKMDQEVDAQVRKVQMLLAEKNSK